MSKHLDESIRVPIEEDNPSIVRIEEKCIKCGSCKEVCQNYVGVHGTYSLKDNFDKAICINCGQCANVCPTDAIIEKEEYHEVEKKIQDPNSIVIFSTSPSVRVALGEEFNKKSGSFVEGKMVALLRALGANYVLDTNFAADLTIIEEASELIERVTKKTKPLPQFTSCCPAWVKFAEIYHPEILDNISSAKSPIGMQGPTIKTYFANKMGIDPKRIVNVALTPCTAKKMEIRREEMNASGRYYKDDSLRDMDYVITTRELARWAKEKNIDFDSLEDSKFDSLMGESTGAATIFGNTGGVMEAALRTAYTYITNKEAPKALLSFTPVRGYEEIKEAEVNIDGLKILVAVIYGTKAADKFISDKENLKKYTFIEVMTCPGGCIGGGGQPKDILKDNDEVRKERIASLYKRDEEQEVRCSHQNEEIKKLYEEFYSKPLSPLAEEMLHTIYQKKEAVLKEKVDTEVKVRYRCKVCGYVHEGEIDENFVCPICNQPASVFEKI